MSEQPQSEEQQGSQGPAEPETGVEGSVVPQESATGQTSDVNENAPESQATSGTSTEPSNITFGSPQGESWQEGQQGAAQTQPGNFSEERQLEGERLAGGTGVNQPTEGQVWGQDVQDPHRGEQMQESQAQAGQPRTVAMPQQPFEQPSVPSGTYFQQQVRPEGEQVLATGDPTPREVVTADGRRITVPPGGVIPAQTPGGDIQPTEQRVHPVPQTPQERAAEGAQVDDRQTAQGQPSGDVGGDRSNDPPQPSGGQAPPEDQPGEPGAPPTEDVTSAEAGDPNASEER